MLCSAHFAYACADRLLCLLGFANTTHALHVRSAIIVAVSSLAGGGSSSGSGEALKATGGASTKAVAAVPGSDCTCKFPFVYKGVTYKGCTKSDHDQAWCSTSVGAENQYNGQWENCKGCDDTGTTIGNCDCKFPFIYEGTEYKQCTAIDHTEPWCATQTNAKGVYIDGKWENCGSCDHKGNDIAGWNPAAKTGDCECIFPFTYPKTGKKYTSCTADDHTEPWCATKVDSEGTYVGEWANCNDCKKGGTAVSTCDCKFPFLYKGITYKGCTKADHTEPWCATKLGADGHYQGVWENCKSCNATGSTIGNCDCKFPFSYKGKVYNQCSTADHTQPWCATAVNSKGVYVDGQWENCGSCDHKGKDIAGWNPAKSTTACDCKFPFYYPTTKKTYIKCTSDQHTEPWCATAVDSKGVYIGEWENCKDCKQGGKAVSTCDCKFPFVYKGVTYKGCTKSDHTEAWCATKLGADRHYQGVWENCKSCNASSTTIGTCECKFPFTHKGVTYNQCATVGTSATGAAHTQPWCATAVNSKGVYIEGKWENCGSCDHKGKDIAGWNPKKATTACECVFPFYYPKTKKTYKACTADDHTEAWCATQVDSKGAYIGEWENCKDCKKTGPPPPP